MRLLGRCCDCGCQTEGWEERRVTGLAGRTALTAQGPVRLRPGHHPRPGQAIVVTASGVSTGATRQARSEIRPTDDDPLAVPVPSFDSPQRPGFWGLITSGGGES
ncbi:hypothetical protein ASF71_14670 [Deinococcus sp. Leaf326]|nr:hypothetical protein ASF71_14670 [Deinococcus sp. Leaf326]